jgi:hypothetical protein
LNGAQLRILVCSFGVLTTALAGGCQRASDTVDVTGTVTWNGALIPSGTIILEPAEQHQAPIGGTIRDGKFLLHAKPGKMRVQIDAVRATQQRDPQTGTLLGEMYIPSRYNRETELTADVTRDGKNSFEFALKN